jgi:hypothetical protein
MQGQARMAEVHRGAGRAFYAGGLQAGRAQSCSGRLNLGTD